MVQGSNHNRCRKFSGKTTKNDSNLELQLDLRGKMEAHEPPTTK